MNLNLDPLILSGKTVVITGGASGIGEAYVACASAAGANVVFGDIDETLGRQVAARTGTIFVRTDVTIYADQLRLFEKAAAEFGTIDHAIANAGIFDPREWFDSSLSLESVQKEPSSQIFDVNIRGTTMFAHLASVYLRQANQDVQDRSLTLVSSVAAIGGPSNFPLYAASKSATVALARCLVKPLHRNGIRVNTICPSLTQTNMAIDAGLITSGDLADNKSHIQSAEDVAQVLLTLSSNSEIHGKTLLITNAESFDVESILRRCESECSSLPNSGHERLI